MLQTILVDPAALCSHSTHQLNADGKFFFEGQAGLTVENDVFENEEKTNEDNKLNENTIGEKSEDEDPSLLCKEIQLGLDKLVRR